MKQRHLTLPTQIWTSLQAEVIRDRVFHPVKKSGKIFRPEKSGQINIFFVKRKISGPRESAKNIMQNFLRYLSNFKPICPSFLHSIYLEYFFPVKRCWSLTMRVPLIKMGISEQLGFKVYGSFPNWYVARKSQFFFYIFAEISSKTRQGGISPHSHSCSRDKLG